VLLDSLTAYGTQIFWPLVSTPVALSTIFIIDPLYTLPLLVGVIAALVVSRDTATGHRINRYGLVLSSLYLAWTLAAKVVVDHRFETALEWQNIAYRAVFTTPAPFNSVLWRAVVMDARGYHEGYYSLLDGEAEIEFRPYPSDEMLLAAIEDHWPVQRLRWFSRGFYSVRDLAGDIVISDLRMGIEPDYVFRFKVGEIGNPHPLPTRPEPLRAERDFSRLSLLWERIWNPVVEMVPVAAGNRGRTSLE
jgi:inner membrane protein